MPNETFSVFFGNDKLTICWKYKDYDDSEIVNEINIPSDANNYLMFVRIIKILTDKLNVIDDSFSSGSGNRKITLTEEPIENATKEIPKIGDIVRYILNNSSPRPIILYKVKIVSYDENENPTHLLLTRLVDSELYTALLNLGMDPILKHIVYDIKKITDTIDEVVSERFPDYEWRFVEKEVIKVSLEDIIPIEEPLGFAKWDYKIKRF
jgi:hypothetical protein